MKRPDLAWLRAARAGKSCGSAADFIPRAAPTQGGLLLTRRCQTWPPKRPRASKVEARGSLPVHPSTRSTGPPVHRSTRPPIYAFRSMHPLKFGFVLLVVRHRQVHVRPVRRSGLKNDPDREYLVLRPSVLTHLAAARRDRSLSAAERPERLLAEEERRPPRPSSPASSRSQPSPATSRFPSFCAARTQRVEDRHHPREVVRVELRLGLDQPRVDARHQRNRVGAVREHALDEQPRRAVEADLLRVHAPRRADRPPTRTAARSL